MDKQLFSFLIYHHYLNTFSRWWILPEFSVKASLTVPSRWIQRSRFGRHPATRIRRMNSNWNSFVVRIILNNFSKILYEFAHEYVINRYNWMMIGIMIMIIGQICQLRWNPPITIIYSILVECQNWAELLEDDACVDHSLLKNDWALVSIYTFCI